MARPKPIPKEFDPAGFVVFWQKYPRRDAKIDAYKAWREKQPNAETQQQILTALEWQTPRWAADDFQFTPYAATYLRGERWNDERRSGRDRRVSSILRHSQGDKFQVPDDEPLG